MRKYRFYLIHCLIVFIATMCFSSCTNLKQVPYFRDISDSTKEKTIVDAPYSDPIIRPDDILSVTIVTIDPTSSAPVNQASVVPVASSNIGVPQLVPGLQVDKNGNISFPIIGDVHVAGLTSYQAKELIKRMADKYYKDTDVQLRFANFQITVIGEVLHPSTFTVPNEKVSVLDAIGMAGDLTIYGRRDNVLLIRENNGQKELHRMDLNTSDLFKSPYFYLKQNDVVYIEPNRSKAIQADAEQTRVITIAASILTGLFLYLRLAK